MSKCEFSFKDLPQLKCSNYQGNVVPLDPFFSSVQVKRECHGIRSPSKYSFFFF